MTLSLYMASLAGYKPLLDHQWWFNPRPVPLGPSLVGDIFAFFGWFLVLGIVLHAASIAIKKRDKLKSGVASRFAALFATTGVLGYVFLFFTYERIPLLGMRFWFGILLIMFVVWLGRIGLYLAKDYPKDLEHSKERFRFEKYLPKRK